MPFVETGSYPTRDGNSVIPWIDGEPAFRRICEAIEAARESVWATVAFMWPSFVMPDGRGSALDVLENAARRGVDVRIVFWRPDAETESFRENAFWGCEAHFSLLADRYRHIAIRWDRAAPGFCQHQKTWIIDARRDDATAFVGGINLNPHSVVGRAHAGEHQNHDVYVEVSGPSVADIHHNFAQRWNEASERHLTNGRWGGRSETDLPLPDGTPPARGGVTMQIQRTHLGDRSIFDQYVETVASAQRTIYLENQYLANAEIADALLSAARRGVLVVAMVPALPDRVSELKGQLAGVENFMLCGMASRIPSGRRALVYVHSKLMIADDEWVTVGSCNLHKYSLFGNSELNATFRDAKTARAMRVSLLGEHIGVDTSELTDVEALKLFQGVALENQRRRSTGDNDWQGMAFALGGAEQ